jgi:hypothetical protein
MKSLSTGRNNLPSSSLDSVGIGIIMEEEEEEEEDEDDEDDDDDDDDSVLSLLLTPSFSDFFSAIIFFLYKGIYERISHTQNLPSCPQE